MTHRSRMPAALGMAALLALAGLSDGVANMIMLQQLEPDHVAGVEGPEALGQAGENANTDG